MEYELGPTQKDATDFATYLCWILSLAYPIFCGDSFCHPLGTTDWTKVFHQIIYFHFLQVSLFSKNSYSHLGIDIQLNISSLSCNSLVDDFINYTNHLKPNKIKYILPCASEQLSGLQVVFIRVIYSALVISRT